LRRATARHGVGTHDLALLLREAHRALYSAKRSGLGIASLVRAPGMGAALDPVQPLP
jgi:GGDEF domain-containing protein